MKARSMSVPAVIFIPGDLFDECDFSGSENCDEQQVLTSGRRNSDPALTFSNCDLFLQRWEATEEDGMDDQQEKLDKARNPPRMPQRSISCPSPIPSTVSSTRRTPKIAKSLPPRCPRRLASKKGLEVMAESAERKVSSSNPAQESAGDSMVRLAIAA